MEQHHHMHNSPLHWGYSGTPAHNTWVPPPPSTTISTAVTSSSAGRGLKRSISESDCDDDYSESSSKDQIKEVTELLRKVPPIYESLEHVRDENTRHSQYAAAIENLKHIFSVQSSVEKAMQWIEEDKLLHAHQCLTDLENSRDDLLFELHKLPKQYAHDKITLKRYFEKVETVSQQLERKLRLILNRTLATVRKEPTVIVTALRIIEREEKADQFALQQQKQTGFIPPGRPKQWRQMGMDILNAVVINRIEASKMEERSDNKLWLIRDLEVVRQFILEDLRVVKSLCVPCFAPSYDIFNAYVKMYHSALSSHLEEIVESGLEGNEFVSMLSWVMNTYAGTELMGHPDLRVDLSIVGPLVKSDLIHKLENEYLKNMENNYQDWMYKTVETEKQEWFRDGYPDRDEQEKYYHTSAPVIIFQMVDQHLQVTNTIHSDLTFKALVLSIKQITIYGNNYRAGIIDFKEKHFKDRNRIMYFTNHIITIVNNCQQIIELAQQMKQLYWPKSRTEHYQEFEKLIFTFQLLRDESASFLLEEAFLDLETNFNDIFTVKWFSPTSSLAIETICLTLEDYFQDYNHLRVNNFEYVIIEAQKSITKRYLKALLSKRLSKPKNECETISKQIGREAKQLKFFFSKIAPNLSETDSMVDLIPTFANLITCDIEMLVFDLLTLLGNYPSLTEDHLLRLFYIRNDIKSSDIKIKIQDAMISKKTKVSPDKRDVIFKEIAFADKLW